MSFDIEIDYSLDTTGLFDAPEARAAMEAAAAVWEALIADEFPPVPAGVAFSIRPPDLDAPVERVVLETPIDDIRVHVGGAELPGATLAVAGLNGFDVEGDAFRARITGSFRDLGHATDLEPFSGTISFSDAADWSFAIDAPVPGRSDFLSTAVHELGHVLGIATAPSYNVLRGPDGFEGPNALAVNGGQPIPLTTDGHVADGFRGGVVLMDPTNTRGTRKEPTEVDLAILADIGYEIAGFEKVGTPFEIATPGPETIFGSIVADRIDGLGGADRIQGGDGDDTLIGGGGGDDTLFGQAGADVFRIGPGAQVTEIADFETGTDRIALDPALGISDPAELLAEAARPFSNVTRLEAGGGVVIRVVHEETQGPALGPDDFLLDRSAEIRGTAGADTLSGTDGADRIEGGAGDDALLAAAGADTLSGGEGTDRALYGAARDALAPGLLADGALRVEAPGGTDLLEGIERIDLIGGAFLYDLEGPEVGLGYRLFAAALGRTPGEGGLRHWVGELAAGRPAAEIAAAFLASAEFAARLGPSAEDADYVAALFDTVLDRAPGESGLAHWTGRLESGALDRPGLLLAFSESPENVAQTAPDLANGVFVLTETDPLLL